MKSTAARFCAGDILYGRLRPYLNKVAQPNFDGLASAEFIVFPETMLMTSRFLKYRLNAADFVSFASHLNEGDRPRVNFDQIGDFQMLIPPPSEQVRIVDKIDELFSELDKGVESLNATRAQLKVYRKAVLKHAFEGKLTAKWRERNKDKIETVEQLLARIRREREARYEHQLREWKTSWSSWRTGGQQGFKPKKPLKPKRLPPLFTKDLKGLHVVPSTWRWVRTGEIGLVGTGVTPLKSKSEYYLDGNIAWLTSGALNDPFVQHPTGYVTESAYNATSLRLYPPHTLVVALYGEGKTRGKCSEILFETTTNQAIAAIVQEGAAAGLRGLLKWFLTKNYEEVRTGSAGGVQPNLNLGIIENTAVPICSISEAKEIEKEIETRFSKADELEEQLVSCLQYSEHLRQSILNRAFRGELVAQDPNDEPASALLDRLKAEVTPPELKKGTTKHKAVNV